MIYIISLIGGDFIFCFISTIIDVKYYTGSKVLNFFINILCFVPLQISVAVLLLMKRKKPCIIGGLLYLIGGIIVWLSKLSYSVYLILSDNIYIKYGNNYSTSVYLISFIINLFSVFIRVGACYIVKKMYADVCTLEDFLHEKEQADFLQSLGTKGSNDDRLCDDEEEIDINNLTSKNPFINKRKKKDDDEEEEICFQSTL